MSLRYNTVTGGTGLLEVDLNYMLRVPLWPVVYHDSIPINIYHAKAIPTLDIHELMAGKLSALFSRHVSRDLFDTHYYFNHYTKAIDQRRLRLAFIIYGGISRKDWRTLSLNDISFTENELKDQLVPVLSRNYIQQIGSISGWANELVTGCRKGITNYLLPLKENEVEFLNHLNDYGKIYGNLLTDDNELIQKINNHPGLLWKAQNVRKFKEISVDTPITV